MTTSNQHNQDVPDEPARHENLVDLLITGPLCTPEEAAALLRLSPRTLADWRAGRGAADTPLPLRFGGRVLYSMKDINDYLQRQIEAAQARRDAEA